MGISSIRIPDVGEGVAQVELVEWHVKPGDMIKEDDVLAAVMTDKATVESRRSTPEGSCRSAPRSVRPWRSARRF